MKSKEWHHYFIETIISRFPKKTQLVDALMELLDLEREATYRRIRNTVPFTIHEVIKISSAWDISLDEITGFNSGKIPFLMQSVNYIAPSNQELMFLQNIIQSINYLKDYPDTEFMDVCNKLPRQLLAGFGYLNQFYLFKWMYQYSGEKKPVPYGQIFLSEEKLRLTDDYYRAIKNVPNTSLIFDRRIFDHLINEVQYFHSIQLITDKEKDLIKKDLNDLLDYLLEVATNGCYPETQNKVNLYSSQLFINTNYSYTFTNQINICFVHVFDKFEIYTFNAEMVANFKKWMQLKKRSSLLISEVDNKGRMEYFLKQRQVIDDL